MRDIEVLTGNNIIMKNALNRLIIFLAIAAILGGCATSSPIESYSHSKSAFRNPPELIPHNYSSEDVYRIYHRASTGFVSVQSIRNAAERRAEDFARRQGKSIIVLGERISQPPYILGNFPRIEIVFAVIDSGHKNSSSRNDRYDELERLKGLLDKGIITQSEFESEKNKILSK